MPRAVITDDAMPTDVPEDVAAAEPAVLPPLADLQVYGYLDPALGKHRERGDYAAIATVGRDKNNILYVLGIWMERVSTVSQVQQAFALHNEYNYKLFGFESNGFQETLRRFFVDEESKKADSMAARWKLPLKAVQNSANKYARIAQLEPMILTGGLVFHVNLPQDFYEQADEFGNSRCHDDALDALAGCVELIQGLDNPLANIRRVRRHEAMVGF